MDFFAPYRERIIALCKEHKVGSLSAFGSAVTGTMNDQSDVDLLMILPLEDPYEYTDNYFALLDAFENLFGRPVDLLDRTVLTNPYLINAIEAQKMKLYEA